MAWEQWENAGPSQAALHQGSAPKASLCRHKGCTAVDDLNKGEAWTLDTEQGHTESQTSQDNYLFTPDACHSLCYAVFFIEGAFLTDNLIQII